MSITKPIIKWVGGKSQILDKLLPMFPKNIKNYYEIFLGGGSVLLGLLSEIKNGNIIVLENIYAYDINEPLIGLYKNIQSRHNELYNEINIIITNYNSLTTDEDKSLFYYNIREKYNALTKKDKSDIIGSAYFIFLNKTCFRGLFRVNKKGGFNVPYGNYKNPEIINRHHLNEIHELIQGVIFQSISFEISLNQRFKEGDIIYLDPPYAPENETSFVSYTDTGFSLDEHKKLFELCQGINCKFIMSNADVEIVKKTFLDKEKYIMYNIECKRAINSKNPGAKTGELIIENII